jgi:hypothetical protein
LGIPKKAIPARLIETAYYRVLYIGGCTTTENAFYHKKRYAIT